MRISGDVDYVYGVIAPRLQAGEIRFYDGKVGVLFDAAPCDHCGKMHSVGQPIYVDAGPEVHRSLTAVVSGMAFMEECGE
jgi:hypothetical protein